MNTKKPLILLSLLFLFILSLILSQSTNFTITNHQTSFLCQQSDYLNNLTNSSDALFHCFTYTILRTNESLESLEDYTYNNNKNLYYLNQGISYHIIFYNTTYDLGITNISYQEFLEISNWIENNLELFYEINIIEEYLYDSNGQRLIKIEVMNSTNQTTYYIGDSFVHIINSSGNFNQTFYYTDGVLIAEKDTSSQMKFYHPDHLGSTNENI